MKPLHIRASKEAVRLKTARQWAELAEDILAACCRPPVNLKFA